MCGGVDSSAQRPCDMKKSLNIFKIQDYQTVHLETFKSSCWALSASWTEKWTTNETIILQQTKFSKNFSFFHILKASWVKPRKCFYPLTFNLMKQKLFPPFRISLLRFFRFSISASVVCEPETNFSTKTSLSKAACQHQQTKSFNLINFNKVKSFKCSHLFQLTSDSLTHTLNAEKNN